MRTLLLAVISFVIAMPGTMLADSVTLKSGEKIEGTITADTPESVTIQFKISETISDERVIPRDEIETITKTQPDEILFEQVKSVKPDPMATLSPEAYDRKIEVLHGFLEKFPASTHAAEVKASIEALKEEKMRVGEGEAKYAGRWLSAAEAERRKVQLQAQQLLFEMKDVSAAGDYIGALNLFAQLEKSYAGTRAYLPAVELARQLVGAVKKQAEQARRNAKTQEEEFKKRLALTQEPVTSQILAARKREQEQADALVLAAEKSAVKWPPLIAGSTKSIDKIASLATSESTRLTGVQLPRMQSSLELADQARAAISSKDFAKAEALLKEAASKWPANEEAIFWSKEVVEMKRAAAATPPPFTPPPLPARVAPTPSPTASATPSPTPSPSPTPTPTPTPAAASPTIPPPAAATTAEPPANKPFLMTVPGALTLVAATLVLVGVLNFLARPKQREEDAE